MSSAQATPNGALTPPHPPISTLAKTSATKIPKSFLNLSTNQHEPADSFFAVTESKEQYEDDYPPFVRKIPKRIDGKLPFDGKRPVIPLRTVIHILFDVTDENIEDELTLYQYNTERRFWVLKAGDFKIIVGGNAWGFRAWVGKEEGGYSSLIARTDEAGKKGFDRFGFIPPTQQSSNEDQMVSGDHREEREASVDSDDENLGPYLERLSQTRRKSTEISGRKSKYSDEEEDTSTPTTKISTLRAPKILKFKTLESFSAESFYELPATLEANRLSTPECLLGKHGAMQRYPNGEVQVIPILDTISKIFGETKDVSSTLVLYTYGTSLAFWALRIGAELVIVKGNGHSYAAWLGPVKKFSGPIANATMMKDAKDTRRGQGAEVIWKGQSTVTEKARTNSQSTHKSVRMVRSLPPSTPAERMPKRLRIIQKLDSTVPDSTVDVSDDTAGRGARDGNQSSASKPTNMTSQGPSQNTLRKDKLDKTNLYVTSSAKAYGGVTIKMSSCRNIDDFFSLVLSAWSLEGKEIEVEAIIAQFNWPEGPKPIAIVQKLPDSFRALVENIEKAPCWKEDSEEQNCEVEVKILMA